MMQLFYRLRPINLLIVAATQLAIYFLVLKPIHQTNSLLDKTIFADTNYYIIVFLTCIICAGGYIINDIFDIEIDKINKPHKALVNVHSWTLIYKSLFILGLLLTIYLSFICRNIYFIPIFILSWLSLYAYSKQLKCTPLWGNLLVALFSASVIIALLGPGITSYFTLDIFSIQESFSSFILYGIVAFLATLIREIIKDMEDVSGDKTMQCNTLPVAVGIEKTKIYAAFFYIVLDAVLVAFMIYFYQTSRFIWLAGLSVILLWAIWLLPKMMRANIPSEFHAIQSQWKYLMMLGLILLLMEPYLSVSI